MRTRFCLPPFSGNNGGMQDEKSSQWKKPPLTSVSTREQPLSAQWGGSVWEGFTDRKENYISFGLYPDIPSLSRSHPFLTGGRMTTPPFSSTLPSPLKSLLYVLFMISGPFLFRVSVHNSAVYVIYDARNNLNHIRSLNIIGALESYIFLVMVKLRQW